MNWITASLFMFVSSVVLYLLVRKSTLLQTPTELKNLAMFLFPIIYYLSISVYQKRDFSINFYELIIIVFSAIFFSYLGNLYSLKSIELSPNPGYSLMISKSYVLLTTIVSVFLFDASLSIREAFSIIIILVSTALIVVESPNKDKKSNYGKWIPLSISAFFCWGLLALTSKYLITLGVDILARLVYSMSITSLLIICSTKKNLKMKHEISRNQLVVLILIGLASTSLNYFMQLGYEITPNIGFINSINAASIAGVSIFSHYIFGDELKIVKLSGVFGALLGILMLVL